MRFDNWAEVGWPKCSLFESRRVCLELCEVNVKFDLESASKWREYTCKRRKWQKERENMKRVWKECDIGKGVLTRLILPRVCALRKQYLKNYSWDIKFIHKEINFISRKDKPYIPRVNYWVFFFGVLIEYSVNIPFCGFAYSWRDIVDISDNDGARDRF